MAVNSVLPPYPIFSEEDGAGSPGGTTEALASDVDAEGLQEAVDAVAGAGNAVVDGGGGSFTITMAGALRGDAAHSWTLAAGSLEGADGAAAELSTTGRSLPFTDGRGRYSWVKLAADASGVLRDDPASGGSRWPLGLARDSNGRADCPEGLLVWMRPGVTAYADAEEVEGDDAFAGWEEEEVAEHLDGLLDGASGLYADALCDFAAWGEHAFWAELTGPPVGGLYPFRAVHLGDAPPGEAAVPELGEGEDFPEGYADGLGAALVSGGTPGDGTFRDALAVGDGVQGVLLGRVVGVPAQVLVLVGVEVPHGHVVGRAVHDVEGLHHHRHDGEHPRRLEHLAAAVVVVAVAVREALIEGHEALAPGRALHLHPGRLLLQVLVQGLGVADEVGDVQGSHGVALAIRCSA
jgi:hypothetical protein